MKYLYIIFIIFMFSCGHKKEKKPIIIDNESKKTVVIKQKNKNVFYNNNNLTVFDFSQFPLSKDIDDISNLDTEKYNIDEWLRKIILEKENYYKLINYNIINSNKVYKTFTVFGNYDYYTNILLVTTNIENSVLIDYKIIASIMGDADNMTEISTSFTDSICFKVTTHKKRLSRNDTFETLSIEDKVFKISSIGQIN